MHFAAPLFLVGTAFAALVALLLVLGALGGARAVARFGDPARVHALMTSDAAKRRAWKGVLLVLATALAFVAAARPQYGKGTRLIPATNLDVVVVLDYSKSMYARDIEPSRIFRAKIEVARLVKELAGARFAAVAFAGEPMGFPLTADGSAIAQFLRQLDPNDMPIGGTAIARALEQARDLLRRDPKSADHKRVVLLVTDGEDLEGDPVSSARAMGAESTTVHVVQIGGRTPERIPEIGPDGQVLGYRTDRDGRPLTTELSVEGEAQLAAIAAATPGGQIVRAEKGTTGIETIAATLKTQMKSELAERVETVYADIFAYPLGLAILLLIVEVFVGEARARVFVRVAPPLPVRGRAALAARSKGKVARPAADRPKKPRSPEASSDERAAPGGMKHAT
jgi:Ca-activated chloride channel family protein